MTSIVVANWKLNPPSLADAKKLVQQYKKKLALMRFVEVIYAPPAVFVHPLASSVRSKRIHFAVQDIAKEAAGARVGLVSASQAASVGAVATLVGHSDCRMRGETNADVAAKIKQALAAKLAPIVFVGELERDRAGRYLHELRRQLREILAALEPKEVRQMILVYEPVWAISTRATQKTEAPPTLSASDLHTMVLYLYKILVEEVGERIAKQVPILYGGSVTPDNAAEIFSVPHLRGVVVGAASLDPEAFLAIARAFNFKKS